MFLVSLIRLDFSGESLGFGGTGLEEVEACLWEHVSCPGHD